MNFTATLSNSPFRGMSDVPVHIVNMSYWESGGLVTLVENYLAAMARKDFASMVCEAERRCRFPLVIVFQDQRLSHKSYKAKRRAQYSRQDEMLSTAKGFVGNGEHIITVGIQNPMHLKEKTPVEELVTAADDMPVMPPGAMNAVLAELGTHVGSLMAYGAHPYLRETGSTDVVIQGYDKAQGKRPKKLTELLAAQTAKTAIRKAQSKNRSAYYDVRTGLSHLRSASKTLTAAGLGAVGDEITHQLLAEASLLARAAELEERIDALNAHMMNLLTEVNDAV